MFSQQTSVCKHPEIIRELFAVLLEPLWFVVGSPASHICALISNWPPQVTCKAHRDWGHLCWSLESWLTHRDYHVMTQTLSIWAARRTPYPSLFVFSLDSTSSLVPSGNFSKLPHTWASCGAFLNSWCICNWQVVTEHEQLTFQCLVWIRGEDIIVSSRHVCGVLVKETRDSGERKRYAPSLDNELHAWFPVYLLRVLGTLIDFFWPPLPPARTPLCKQPFTEGILFHLLILFLVILLNCRWSFPLGRNISKY